MHCCKSFLTGCWSVFWVYLIIGLPCYGRQNSWVWLCAGYRGPWTRIGMMHIWYRWWCVCTANKFQFGFSSCTVSDDFEVYADTWVTFCSFNKVLWRVRQEWSMKFVYAKSYRASKSIWRVMKMCEVGGVVIWSVILAFSSSKEERNLKNIFISCYIVLLSLHLMKTEGKIK